MKKPGTLLLAMVVVAGCTTTTHKVYKVPPASQAEDPDHVRVKDGLVYALPRTVFTVTLNVTKTTSKTSIFKGTATEAEALRYAKLLGLKNLGEKKPDAYKLKSASVETSYEADPTEVYLVEIPKSRLQNQTLSLTLSELGVYSAAKSKSEDKRLATGVKVLETVAGLVGKVIGLGGITDLQAISASDILGAAELLADKELQQMAEDISAEQQVLIDAEVDSDKKIKKRDEFVQENLDNLRRQKRGNLVRDKLYELALADAFEQILFAEASHFDPRNYFDKIREIQTKKLALSAGDGPDVSKDTIEFMLKQLNALEKELMAAFKGAKTVKVWPMKFVLRPPTRNTPVGEENNFFEEGLIHVDAATGITILDKGGFVGAIQPGFAIVTSTAAPRVYLKITVNPKEQIYRGVEKISSIQNTAKDRSFRYRVPAVSHVMVKQDDKIKVDASTLVAQFGTVLSLPSTTVASSAAYDIALYEATGALKKIDFTSTAPSTDQIASIGKVLGTFVQPDDDLAELDREVKMLELELKRRELLEKLEGEETEPGQ